MLGSERNRQSFLRGQGSSEESEFVNSSVARTKEVDLKAKNLCKEVQKFGRGVEQHELEQIRSAVCSKIDVRQDGKTHVRKLTAVAKAGDI